MIRRIMAIGLLAASCFGVVAGISLSVVRTAAAWFVVEETGKVGHLWLTTDHVERFDLSPGEPHHLQVRASLVDPLGSLAMQIRREGELIDMPGALMVLVRHCAGDWTYVQGIEASCPGVRTDLIGPVALSDPMFGGLAGEGDVTPIDAPTWHLGTISNTQDETFLVTLWIEDTSENRNSTDLMGLEATIGIGLLSAAAESTEVSVPSDGELPATGADLGVIGLVAVGMGGILVGARLLRKAS